MSTTRPPNGISVLGVVDVGRMECMSATGRAAGGSLIEYLPSNR